jgi:hypothetical protein
VANQQGFNLNLNGAAGITNATVTNAPSRRNAPVWQIQDTVNWTQAQLSLGAASPGQLLGKGADPCSCYQLWYRHKRPGQCHLCRGEFPGAAAGITRAAGIYAL